ncbi:MAG: SRPBCC family protein, partial [Acidimicrobiia bacterium]
MTHDIRLERLFDAPPEQVWAICTDPANQKELWFGGPDVPDFTVVRLDCDLRVGGHWNVAFGTSEEDLARESNVFQVIDPPKRIVWTSKMVPSSEMIALYQTSEGWTLDTTIEVTFEGQDGKTRMSLVQTGFPDAATRDGFLEGWP